MNGYTEDILNGVIREITRNWERMEGDVKYFANIVLKSGLTTADLDNYLIERGKIGHIGVTIVFNSILASQLI